MSGDPVWVRVGFADAPVLAVRERAVVEAVGRAGGVDVGGVAGLVVDVWTAEGWGWVRLGGSVRWADVRGGWEVFLLPGAAGLLGARLVNAARVVGGGGGAGG